MCRYTVDAASAVIWGLTALLSATLPGCAGCASVEELSLAEELSGIVLDQDEPYTQWSHFPGFEGFFPAGFPHGPEARTFINPLLEDALGGPMDAFPDGAIIVKENDDEDVFGLSNTLDIMYKVDGFSERNNDWFWLNITRSGEINFVGDIAIGTNCHGGRARDNDFVFLYDLDGAPADAGSP